jgi:competence protein ComEC
LLLSQSSWPVWCVDDQSPFRWRQTWRRWPPGLRPATLQTLHLAHPILLHLVSSALVAGFVEAREQREHGDRIVVGVQRFEAASIGSAPERVRVAVRKGTAPAVGSFVEFKAHLSPPLQPLRPGGYEFARDMYFQRIGASGYALVKVKSPPVAQGFWLRYASIIDALREGIDKRIRGVTGGDHGSIASALITGKRDTISGPVNDAMYVSSLSFVASCRCAIGLWSNQLRIADLGFI